MSNIVQRVSSQDAGSSSRRRVPGELGLWALILSDSTVFTFFFSAYLVDRGRHPQLFSEGQRTLHQSYGVINTLLLLTGSLMVVIGVEAVRGRCRSIAAWLFGGAILCGLGFALTKVLEYGDKISHGISPASSTFYTHYFTLTGLHFFHAVVGIVVLVLMVRTSCRQELTSKQLNFVEGGACFWHMVDFLWIVIFPLLYLVR